MDRIIFKSTFKKVGFTKYPCPICNKGNLKVKEDTFNYEETKMSTRDRSHGAWEPEWIEYLYSCLFECTNVACGDTVSSSGVGSVSPIYSYDEEGNPDIDFEEFFNPKYFSPHLRLFHSPEGIPEGVQEEIEKSFSLFFCDPSSSANHIRVALEYLLTHLKIKRFTTTSRRRRRFLALHERIELLPRKYDHVKEFFVAIKWLGNAGSHSHQEVTSDDVLDAYELMEELLVEIFENKREKAKSLAKKINKKKGPK